MKETSYRVGQVAKLARVSVRTLHHYDSLGLVAPSGRSASGYRLYTGPDLERLQQVLYYRELGFKLEDIRDLVLGAGVDRRAALVSQQVLLRQRIERFERMLELVERSLNALNGDEVMGTEEMFGVFDDFDPSEYEEEVKQRWGHTDAYKESERRSKRYTKEDWQRFKAESEEINSAIVALMDKGIAPDDSRAMDAVDRHRRQIDEWFYPCSREMHAELGRMYVEDPRFTATYEKIREGMAEYVMRATAANAAR